MRSLRIIVTTVVVVVVLAVAAYCAARLLLIAEVHRAASFEQRLWSIQLGQSEGEVLGLLGQYKSAQSWQRGIPPDSDRYYFRLDPLHVLHRFPGPEWLDQSVRRMLQRFGNERRYLGLRVWGEAATVRVEEGKVQSVSLDLIIEGENEWLMARSSYAPAFTQDKSSKYLQAATPPSEINRYHIYWNHVLWSGETGEGIVNSVTQAATPEELHAARDINWACVIAVRGCHSLCDLMPEANRFRRLHNYGDLGWNSGSWSAQDHACH